MPLLPFSSKYTNIDWCVFSGVQPNTSSLLEPSVIQGGLCTGIQKLVQRWLIRLMTIKGSMPFAQERGCGFISEISKVQTESAVRIAYLFAQMEIEPQLLAEETEDMPDDERFLSSELLGVSRLRGACSLSVKLTSRAGESREVLLPIYETGR
ncbi:MAG: hypothetical protein Q4D38_00105 [Planctomycetia bacterium]|nr:hypothetical protein [Planctomycetia bacterium]